MQTDKKSLLVGYLQRNLLVIFGSEINGVLSIDFTQDSVMDLEVVDRTKLENQIKVFIANFKIEPENMILVLSESVIFQKDIIGVSSNELDFYIQDFLDNVPLDHMSSKLFVIENGVKVVAVNKELYESIGKVFQDLGFFVLSVIPEILLDKNIVDPTTGIDTDITPFLEKIEYIKTNNLWSAIIQLRNTPPADKKIEPKKDNKRLYILVSIFLFFLFILALLLIKH